MRRKGNTHQEHSSRDVNLALRTKDHDDVGSILLVREADLGVRLSLNIVNEDVLLAQQGPVVATRHRERLINEVLVLPD